MTKKMSTVLKAVKALNERRGRQVRLVLVTLAAFTAGVGATYFTVVKLNGGASATAAKVPEIKIEGSADEAVALAKVEAALDEGPDEVNEFAQDEDDDTVTSTNTTAQAAANTEKSVIDLSYMMNLVSEITSFKANSVEAPPVESPLVWEFDRESVLADSESRIGLDFHVPELLKERVGFWFDVYTKWNDNQRIIHNSRYPWIVFKVVDVTSIVENELPKHLWMRREKAEKLVKADVEQIKKALRSLSTKKTNATLNETEQSVADALKPLGGDLRKQAQRALGEVRVQVGQRNFFQSGLEISPRYLTTMESIFRKLNLPIELTRIPLVESSFNKQATSKVGATGIWQFMGNTGRKFMVVNEMIDERRSPFKASEAAAHLLKENHLILHHSWPLAVTAWNHGPGGVRKAAKASGSFDLGTIVKKYRSRSFDFASSNFYSEFLAALHAERYADIAFPPIKRMSPVEIDVVRIHKATRIKELLKVTGLTMEDFLLINPDLATAAKKNAPVPIGFRLHVPAQVRSSLTKEIATAESDAKRDS